MATITARAKAFMDDIFGGKPAATVAASFSQPAAAPLRARPVSMAEINPPTGTTLQPRSDTPARVKEVARNQRKTSTKASAKTSTKRSTKSSTTQAQPPRNPVPPYVDPVVQFPASRTVPQSAHFAADRTASSGGGKGGEEVCRVELNKVSPKKHSFRFDTNDDDAHIKTVYVSREAFCGRTPKSITVIVEM